MIEPFVCGGDAAFLSNYFDHLSSSFVLLFIAILYGFYCFAGHVFGSYCKLSVSPKNIWELWSLFYRPAAHLVIQETM